MSDPTGATIGAWQPDEMQGFGLIGEPGAPAWFELHTRTTTRPSPFYRDVFGWDTHTDERHARVPLHDARRGRRPGGRDHGRRREGAPSYWTIYFHVEDADKTLAKVEALGGTVADPRPRHPVRPARHRGRPARFKLRRPSSRFGVTYAPYTWGK